MKNTSMMALLLAVTAVGVAAALWITGRDTGNEIVSVPKGGSPPAEPAGQTTPSPWRAPDPDATPSPAGGSSKEAPSGTEPEPASEETDAGGAGRPPAFPPVKRLSREDLERMRRESERQAEEHVKARRKKELAMFEEIMGPLDEQVGQAFLDIYYGYHNDAAKEFRQRVTDAVQKARKNGLPGNAAEMPDRDKIFSEAREKALRKLEPILDPVQFEKFRTWWEEKCHPRRDK